MSTNKTYFYLQLKTDFFDEPEIKIILGEKNGPEYIILWQKLLHLAIKGNPIGSILVNGNIPYSPEMISSVTGINVDIVRVGIKMFEKLDMLVIRDSGEIWIEQAKEMVSITTSEAIRHKERRLENKRKLMITNKGCSNEHEVNENRTPELDIELELKKEKKESSAKASHRFIIPSVEEIRQYVGEMGWGVNPEQFHAFYSSKGWKVGKNPMVSWKDAVKTWQYKDNPKSSAKKINVKGLLDVE